MINHATHMSRATGCLGLFVATLTLFLGSQLPSDAATRLILFKGSRDNFVSAPPTVLTENTAVFTAAQNERSGVSIRCAIPGGRDCTLDFAGPDAAELIVGQTYSDTGVFRFATPGQAGLTIVLGTEEWGWEGQFTIHQLFLSESGVIEKFRASFQADEASGTIEYRSDRQIDPPSKGIFVGLMEEAYDESFRKAQVAVTASGTFSAVLRLEERVVRFRGEFDADGLASGEIGELFEELNFYLVYLGNEIIGSIGERGSIPTYFRLSPRWRRVKNGPPCPAAGEYSIQMEQGRLSDDFRPRGPGWAKATVTNTGSVKWRGRLPGNTTVSFGGYLLENQRIDFAVSYIRGAVSFIGRATFAKDSETGLDMIGKYGWKHLFHENFHEYGSLTGVRFSKPVKGTEAITNSAAQLACKLTLFNYENEVVIEQVFLMRPDHKITVETNDLKLKLSANGLFHGSYTDPVLGNPLQFTGVVFQPDKTAKGLWIQNAPFTEPPPSGAAIISVVP